MTNSSGEQRRLRGWAAAALAILLYFLLQLPFASTLLVMHPDERHYAYSAAHMVETGDWLVPRTPAGELRLRKPILPYWISAAGFKTVGMSVLGSRLFWVFCALGILAVTYAFARALGAGEGASLLAMFLTAGNPLFLRASVNAIPDLPLTLFMLVSALGFVRLINDPDPPRHAAWLAWIGAALAVLSKGILPLIFVAVVLTSTFIFARARLRSLLPLWPVLAALALAAAWYVYVILLYPAEFYAEFVGDQLTKKVARNPFEVPLAIAAYVLIATASFFGLPLVLAALARARRSSPRDLPPVVKVLGVWLLTVPLVFSAGGFISERYLLPVVPVLAVLVVLGFGALDPQNLVLNRVCRYVLAFALIVEAAFLAFYVAIAFQLAPLWEALVVLGLAAAVLAVVFRSVWTSAKAAFVLPASLIVVAALSVLPLRHLVMPHPGELLAERLAAANIAPARAVLIGDSELSSAVRLHAPRAEMFYEAGSKDLAAAAGACVVMTDKPDLAADLEQRGFSVEKIYGGWRLIHAGQLLKAVWHGRLADVQREAAEPAFFARCAAG